MTDQARVVALCRNLVALADDPHPGVATWNIACEQTRDELLAALSEPEEDWEVLPVGASDMIALHTAVCVAALCVKSDDTDLKELGHSLTKTVTRATKKL